jgi:hypothetical protein
MKSTLLTSMVLASVASVTWAATCVPIITNNVTVDGLVVGGDISGAGPPKPVKVPPSCNTTTADVGWTGVIAQDFALAAGNPISGYKNILFATHQSGNNGPMDKIYLALHVEGAPDFGGPGNDNLTLYFKADATNPNWDPAKDFALQVSGFGPPQPVSDAQCAPLGNPPTYYRRDGGNTQWVPQANPPVPIVMNLSYAYDAAHFPQSPLWELEASIDVSGMNILQGGTIGIGARLYVTETGVQGVTAYHYPQNLSPNPDDTSNPSPNFDGVMPNQLQALTIGGCTRDVLISEIHGFDDQGNEGQFTVNFPPGTDFSVKHNNFSAKVFFGDPNNAALTGTVGVPNSGNVKFSLLPYGPNGPFSPIPVQTVPLTFTQFGTTLPATATFPHNAAEWAANQAALTAAGHVCMIVDLSDFPVDQPNGNHMQRNLTYVMASTVKTNFLVSAPREAFPLAYEEPSRDGRIEYVLRVHWDNLPPKFLSGAKPFSYRITNAAAVGLKNIGKGYYAMRLKPGEQRRVMLEITGGPMPNPNVQYKLAAQAGGKLLQPASGEPPLEIPVKPGAMVSVLTRGTVVVEKHQPSDANGYVNRDMVRQQFLLRPGYYRPDEHIGAVIGSCDKFATAFVLGANSTFVVPEQCDRLLLAVNGVAGHFDDNKGAFEVNVVVGEPLSLPARLPARGAVANAKAGIPAQLEPGILLPQLVVDASQRFEKPKLKHFRLVPAGYSAFAIYATHEK